MQIGICRFDRAPSYAKKEKAKASAQIWMTSLSLSGLISWEKARMRMQEPRKITT
jgi:hypothetical protein